MDETKKLSEWLVKLRYEDLPSDVVDFTKNFILDDIGCMIGGSLQLANKALIRDAIDSEEKKESTVACYGMKTTMPVAAMINGAFIAGWDYDSMAADGGGHMGSQTAALLAVGENTGSAGKDLILAECAGIEAQCRIGRSALIRHKGIGGGGAYPWHSNTSL
ncbi:MAG: MmgE/PrpD family protein, partial [Spirochaetales bacterium]|nr:MmgE/PrpD family protein [Spirochaetales bacterium]